MDEDELSAMTVAELKAMLKASGAPTGGRKADLIERLLALEAPEEDEEVILLEEDEEEAPAAQLEEAEEVLEADAVLEAEIFEAEILEPELDEAVPMRDAPRVADGAVWWKDTTNLATILVVALLGSAGGWWYLSETATTFQTAPARYGDRLDFSVSGGLLLAEGDEMVAHLRDAAGGGLDAVCGELRIAFDGSGSAAITKGGLADLKDPADNHLEGAVMANGPYGRTWNAVESNIHYDLSADLSGYSWSAIDPDSCSHNTDWSRKNNQVDIDVTQWVELTERLLLRTDTAVDFRDSDAQHTSAAMTTFGAVSGSDVVTDMLEVALLPTHPVDLYDVFGLTELTEGRTGHHEGWDWRVGATGTAAGQDAIRVYMEHVEIQRCLGRATIALWVIPDQPLPASQSVDIVLDGRGDGTCDTGMKLAIEYAFPDGTFTSKYTLTQTAFTRGGDLLDWKGVYATRPSGSSGVPDESDRVSWNAGTHMWDNSTSRAFTLEQAVACVKADAEGFASAHGALNSDGYVFAAQDDRSGDSPVWNLSWVSSAEAGWVRVTWPGGDGCLNSGDGPIASEDRPEHNRVRIPATLLLADVEARMTSSSLYPDLAAQVTESGALRDDAAVGYGLVIPEDNPVTDLLPDEYLDGKVTVHIERTWTSGGEEHTLRAAMDGETGRMAGWLHLTTPPE